MVQHVLVKEPEFFSMPSSSSNLRSFATWISTAAPAPTGIRRAPRIVVAAFEGWNDAGEVATDAAEELARQTQAEHIGTINEDEYYDFQMNRPVITRSEGSRGSLSWPSTKIFHSPAGTTTAQQPELYFMIGTEPSLNWRRFVDEILDAAEDWDADGIITIGALLADVPHSRPLTPTVSSTDDRVVDGMEGVATPNYEGPTGIIGVLAHQVVERGWPGLSSWVAVPHYVAQSPSPKALLSLLTRLEELLDLKLDFGSLSDDAAAWERGVNELAKEDPEVAAYIQRLEEARDTEELTEASGESIAREFQQYLKRRDEDPGDSRAN